MSADLIHLPPDPNQALEEIRRQSAGIPVMVLKKSPVCPVSWAAEREWREFLANLGDPDSLLIAEIDVIAEKALARGLTKALNLRHESPQALLFHRGDLTWHASHEALNLAGFQRELGALLS